MRGERKERKKEGERKERKKERDTIKFNNFFVTT